jgi:hypothetical protein
VNSLSLDIPYLQQLESDHKAEINSINDNMSKVKAAHEKAIMALETDFNEKLTVEYDKYQTLEAHTNKISEDYERYDWLTSLYSIVHCQCEWRISCQKDNYTLQHFCHILN